MASLNSFNAVNVGRVQSLIKQKFDESGIVPEEDGTIQIYKKVKLNDGLQIPANAGVDKILVSDADGNATWQENSGEATTISLTSDDTSGTYYLPFAKAATGSQALYTDNTGDTLTYNPSSGVLTASRFDGYLNGPINVSDQSDLNGTRWITFCDNIGLGANTIAADSGLTYNPASNALLVNGTVSADSFDGNATSASTLNVSSDNTNDNYPIVFAKNATGNQSLYTGASNPLNYNPYEGTINVKFHQINPDYAYVSESVIGNFTTANVQGFPSNYVLEPTTTYEFEYSATYQCGSSDNAVRFNFSNPNDVLFSARVYAQKGTDGFVKCHYFRETTIYQTITETNTNNTVNLFISGIVRNTGSSSRNFNYYLRALNASSSILYILALSFAKFRKISNNTNSRNFPPEKWV